MQRVRYRSFDGVHWGELEGGMVHQLTGMLGRAGGHRVPLSDVALLPPCEPSVIVCVGELRRAHPRDGQRHVAYPPNRACSSRASTRSPALATCRTRLTNDLRYEGGLAVVIARDAQRASRGRPRLRAGLHLRSRRDRARQATTDLQWVRGKLPTASALWVLLNRPRRAEAAQREARTVN